MKKLVKIIGGLLLGLLYGFAIYAAGADISETHLFTKTKNQDKHTVTSVSKPVLAITSDTDPLTFFSNPYQDVCPKLPFTDHTHALHVQEDVLRAKMQQYVKAQRNILINYRKTDSIFPFQYFW